MIAFSTRVFNNFVEVDRHDGRGFVVPALDTAWPSTATRIASTIQWLTHCGRVVARFPQFGEYPYFPLLPHLLAIVYTESSGRANAVGGAGEIGLCQIMPSTAALYGVADTTHLADPETNLTVCAQLLLRLERDAHGELAAVSSMYNAGPAELGGGIIGPKHRPASLAHPWGFVETTGYISSVISAYNYFLRCYAIRGAPSSARAAGGLSGPVLLLGLAYFFSRGRK